MGRDNNRAFQILNGWRESLEHSWLGTSDDSYITRGEIRAAAHAVSRIGELIAKGERLPKEGLLAHCYGPGTDWSDHAVARGASSYLDRVAGDLKQAGYDIEPNVKAGAWFAESAHPRDVRTIVWESPWSDHAEGEKIGQVVGALRNGQFRTAEVSMTEEPGARYVSWKWNAETYALKEHAIYAARESIARTLKDERQMEMPGNAEVRESPAQKYGGGSEPIESELPPPRRSR
jgi:hypothetical protein